MLRNWRQLPQIPLRITVGGALIYHSAPMLFTYAGHQNFEYMLQQVGLPMPSASAWMVALIEFLGGLALVLGFAVGSVGIVLIVELLTRISVIYFRGHGFPVPLPGQAPLPDYEMNLLYIGGMIPLLFSGSGLCSIEHFRMRRAAARAAGKTSRYAAA